MTAPAGHAYPKKQSQGSGLGVPPATIGSAAENSHRASAQRALDGAAQPLFRVIPRSGCADEQKTLSPLRLIIYGIHRVADLTRRIAYLAAHIDRPAGHMHGRATTI